MLLDRIVAAKRTELAERRARRSEAELEAGALAAAPAGGFLDALRPQRRGSEVRLIAEIKKASPSRGVLRTDFDPVAIARQYQAAGAAAISVLTDEKFFQGSLHDLAAVRRQVSLPLLRKDFILGRYQLLEAREAGASAALLIVAILDDRALRSLLAEARALGLEALVEVHSEAELQRALEADARIIGINNRDLSTFEVDLATTLRLRPRVPPDRVLVSESGILTRDDVLRLQEAEVDAVLVGEALMKRADPGAAVRELLGTAR